MTQPKKVSVLGAGLVGGPMALDLARDPAFQVSVHDRSEQALDRLRDAGVQAHQTDLSHEENIRAAIADADLVLNAVPGFMGFSTVRTVIEASKNLVDIAFFPEDPFELDALAKQHGVVAVVDCGVAPGMSNLLTGYGATLLDEVTTALTYVGGLPELRRWPYEYKAVFSPIDVIEEYTRPARYIENGQLVTRPALSDAELLDFPGLGTLEAFNTDGLRTLMKTIDCPNLKEKTLRYPGHIEKMAVLRETGFFSEDPVDVGGVQVRPIDLTAKLLFPKWKLQEGEVDVTVMQVIVEGNRQGKRLRHTWDLLDRYDAETGIHSMARTTGYTATVALRLVAQGLYDAVGISPPEYLGKDPAHVEYMLAGLAARGVTYKHSTVELGPVE